MLKISPSLFCFLLLLFLLSAGPLTAAEEGGQPPNSAGEQEKEGGGSNDDNTFDLALKTILLSQGEGGFELWRLKAEWANIQKKDDIIFLLEPRLTYFLREDGKTIHVHSVKGEAEQKKQILRFIDQVRVTQEDKILTGDLLVYNGTQKTMTMAEGAALSTTGMEGKADHVIWHIDERRIESIGDVVMHLNSLPSESQQRVPALESLNLDTRPESGQVKAPDNE